MSTAQTLIAMASESSRAATDDSIDDRLYPYHRCKSVLSLHSRAAKLSS
jgi:hypothetical protein